LLEQFAVVFLAVSLAELGDKTQLAAIALAAKYKEHLHIIAGSALAFTAATALAVAIGGLWGSVLNAAIIKSVSGLFFIALGVHSLLAKEEREKTKVDGRSAFLASLALIFTMEIGDKTNIANILFASFYNPLVVLCAAVLAEVSLTALAVLSARALSCRLSHDRLRLASALLFILTGAAVLLL